MLTRLITLYGMLYALAAALGKESARPFSYGSSEHKLDTISAAETLLTTYRTSLAAHYQGYKRKVFDDKTGLISRSVRMSGAKDITMRESAFFDNVVFWKTTELAQKMGIIPADKPFLHALKSRILETFWLEGKGYFLEDLSDEGVQQAYYSSDWLIVLATGFISPQKKSERHFYQRSVEYIEQSGVAKPFAIKYQHERRAHRQFPIVRLAVASYGGDTIWSFWGMEYIKVLLALYRETGEAAHLTEADYHIKAYETKMLEYGGFPELYDANGKLLETPFYRSIRQTGWVVGFDQVRAIRRTL